MDEYVLSGTVPQHLDQDEVNPLRRFRPLTAWLDARYSQGVDPYSKYTSTAIAPTITAHGRYGDKYEGINFASQEYLNLSTHPEVIDAAKTAMDQYGVHSA